RRPTHVHPVSPMHRRPPPPTLFPYTTLFRSCPESRPRAARQRPAPPGATARRTAARGCRDCETSGPWSTRLGGCSSANRVLHGRSEEHTSELQSRVDLVCRLLLEKKKKPEQ